jgi:adenylosuccinate synthase
MSCTVIVGTQFGDEGKGKVVDYYGRDADIVVRYNGGANAGHTVIVGTERFAFRLLPSGVLRPDKTVVIGHGVVVDPDLLLAEIAELRQRGVTPATIYISDRAHVVMPYHKALDGIEETLKGSLRAGTTKRGIGPCYSDKVARFGIRVCDLLDEAVLQAKLEAFLPLKERVFAAYGEDVKLPPEPLKETCLRQGAQLAPYVTDTITFLHEALLKKKRILLEGAQGTHLDIDYGIYPFGTSSNAVAGGACTGAGIPPSRITQVIGVVKAYTSRVGEGPFPTELKGQIGEDLREKGGEYGTVTQRPRRCGWLDMVMVNYALRVNGVASIALTKLDVLSGLDAVKVGVAYDHHGDEVTAFPANMRVLSECQPIYETLEGWDEVSRPTWLRIVDEGHEALPPACRRYIEFIEGVAGVPVRLISVGPERALTLRRDD